jgi:hypothetical protein
MRYDEHSSRSAAFAQLDWIKLYGYNSTSAFGLAGSSAGQALTCVEQRNEEGRRPDVAGTGREGKGMLIRPGTAVGNGSHS